LYFVALDFETAGPGHHTACAVGLVVVSDGEFVAERHFLIRPPTNPFLNTRIHGITSADVRTAPRFDVVWNELSSELTAAEFIAAHNASFDRRVLEACCRHHRIPLPELEWVCTMRLAKRVLNLTPYNLRSVCDALGIPLDHHDPLSDAYAAAQIVLAAAERGWSHGS